jgi:hypothetical protein
MSHRPTTAAARETCERLGYEPQEDDPLLAHPTDDATPVAGDPVPIEVSTPDPAEPHGVLAVVARAAARDRVALLVARDAEAERLRSTLATPPLVAAETDTGERTFHTGSDRVHLAEGGLALFVDTDGPPHLTPTFEWAEGTADGDADPDRTGSDDRPLTLTVDGDPLTTLDGVETLACPGPARERFTHFYRREDDRLFHVYTADGEPVGVFSTVAAMRGCGFHPVPAPVVPEHVFHDATRAPRRSWAVLDAASGRVLTDAGPVE